MPLPWISKVKARHTTVYSWAFIELHKQPTIQTLLSGFLIRIYGFLMNYVHFNELLRSMLFMVNIFKTVYLCPPRGWLKVAIPLYQDRGHIDSALNFPLRETKQSKFSAGNKDKFHHVYKQFTGFFFLSGLKQLSIQQSEYEIFFQKDVIVTKSG